MGERWQRIATFGVGAAFCATCVALVGQSFRAVLSVDEGYNLEVVDTLARTGVYASYGSHRFDAAWSTPRSWGQLAQYLQQVPPEWPFDPRVTTGPAVLVPLAAAYALTDRNIQVLRGVVIWGFWLLALAALWRLTPRGEHRLLGFFSAAAIFCTLWFGFHPSAVLGARSRRRRTSCGGAGPSGGACLCCRAFSGDWLCRPSSSCCPPWRREWGWRRGMPAGRGPWVPPYH